MLRSGRAHVEREHLGRGIVVAQLGAGEVFGEISPASAFVVVKELANEDWLVEIEADAIAAA